MIRFCLKNDFALNPILLKTPSLSSLLDFNNEEKKKILDFYFSEIEPAHFKLITPIVIPLIEKLPRIDKAYYYQELKRTT